MANPIPQLEIVRFKGSGAVEVFPLLAGIILGTTDGLVGSAAPPGLEGVSGSSHDIQANRFVEAFGKRYILHGLRVYEKDSGGAGTWGEVTGLGLSATSVAHSGIFLLHPNGIATLAFLYRSAGGTLHAVSTTDGTTWSDVDTLQITSPTNSVMGPSIVYRDSIFWAHETTVITRGAAFAYDFALGAAMAVSIPTATAVTRPHKTFLVHKNTLFISHKSTVNAMRFSRFTGTSFTDQQQGGSGRNGPGSPIMFSDGDDIIFYSSVGASGTSAKRISNTLGTFSFSSIPSNGGFPVFSGDSQFYAFVSMEPDPNQKTIYIWYTNGDFNTGNFDLYRYQYRQITHGTVTSGPFIIGTTVTQAITGATGKIMEAGVGSIDLTDVTGTFDATNILTATNGATAAASSLLVEQPVLFIGAGVSTVIFGLPDGTGNERIPAKTNARLEWAGAIPKEVANARRRREFKVFGTGVAINANAYYSIEEEIPDKLVTIAAVGVISGSASIPTLVGNTITGLTPDDGATIYFFDHDSSADGLAPGDRLTIALDIA